MNYAKCIALLLATEAIAAADSPTADIRTSSSVTTTIVSQPPNIVISSPSRNERSKAKLPKTPEESIGKRLDKKRSWGERLSRKERHTAKLLGMMTL